jgi:hypothetical protein
MTFRDRAVRVGGYFTCGLLLINGLLADMGPVPTVVVSLVPGLAFTAGSLAFGSKYRLR